MMRWRIIRYALAVAGVCLGSTLATAQVQLQPIPSGTPATVRAGLKPPTTGEQPTGPIVVVYPQQAGAPLAQSASHVSTGAVTVAPGAGGIQIIQVQDCANCSAQSGKGSFLHRSRDEGCGCNGNGKKSAHPILHCLGMDCWAHHDEFGCQSFCSNVRFIFGSCRDYFGEKCGPPLAVPVPPGYTVLPPDPRNGPTVEVPPNPWPPARP